jgi:hypothetical protein
MKRAKKPMGYYDDIVYEAVEQGIFEIDSRGRVWRLWRPQTSRWGGETVLVRCKRRRAENFGKYLYIKFTIDGERVHALAHRVVYRHFMGPIPEGLTINHKNGKKHDNRPENLEPMTLSEQRFHALYVLRCRRGYGVSPRFGSDNPMAKLTASAVIDIRSHQERGAGVRMARKYGVSVATVSRVRNEVLWRQV